MSESRKRFVWFRFFLVAIAFVALIVPVFLCILVAWLFRLLSRLISYLLQKVSFWLFSAFEWFSVKIGFLAKKEDDEVFSPPANDQE